MVVLAYQYSIIFGAAQAYGKNCLRYFIFAVGVSVRLGHVKFHNSKLK